MDEKQNAAVELVDGNAVETGMDWDRLKAAIIRWIWTFVLTAVAWAAVGTNLVSIGVPESWAAIASAGAAALAYFLKKLAWPNATW